MRIGFLFNHDQTHQVAHLLPVALATLAAARETAGTEVVIAATSDALAAEIARLAARLGPVPPVARLDLRRRTRAAAWALGGVLPVAKLGVYGDNLDFFRALDALVVAEKTSLLLKSRYGLGDLRLIHTRHGAGDRAIGFNKASAGFDHVLVSGPKVRDRLVAEAGVDPDRLSTVGYPKFDLWPEAAPALPFAGNGRPTVLYNPHPSPHLSSWYRHGRAVLEAFRRSTRYNLIFAPHVMLFHRRCVVTIDRLRVDRPGRLDPRLAAAPHVHVDLGSAASTDMSYTAAADIYLGDVSSQVYEFLHRPRPCLFLNSHGVRHRGDRNYAHWQAGEVIDGPERLEAALDRAVARHDRFRPVQRQLHAQSFELTAEASAARAARAVLGVLGVAPAVPTAPAMLPAARDAA